MDRATYPMKRATDPNFLASCAVSSASTIIPCPAILVIINKAVARLVFLDSWLAENKERVVTFVEKHLSSSRKTLRKEAENFLEKWNLDA